MNLTESVRILTERGCSGIRRKEWQKNTYLVIGEDMELVFACGTSYLPFACDFTADDYELVSPKPQMETVEVKRFVAVDRTGCESTWVDKENVLDACSNCTIVELTGTYQREIKPKVKRRQEVTRSWATIDSEIIPTNAKFYAEWEA